MEAILVNNSLSISNIEFLKQEIPCRIVRCKGEDSLTNYYVAYTKNIYIIKIKLYNYMI